MTYRHRNSGTCSTLVQFDIESGKLHNVTFTGGCNGNLKGISALLEGMDAAEAARKLKGLKCGFKSTSCPDQLSRAIEEALGSEKVSEQL